MGKYKISFENGQADRMISRQLKTKSEAAAHGFAFKKNGVKYSAQEYNKNKETGKYGWNDFEPSNFCHCCGRHLTDPKSMRRGIGPICWNKGARRTPEDAPKRDHRINILNGSIAKRVLDSIPKEYQDKCCFCCGDLGYTVFYYEHDGGWFIPELDKKVWLWLECERCGHQWSMAHLRANRNIIENIS